MCIRDRAGVLPAGQEAAEKALEKGCEVYRLYSDYTEGLCVDAKEIACLLYTSSLQTKATGSS